MIYAINVINFKGEELRMELTNPEESGMVVCEVDGIGSGEAEVNMNETATIDGAAYNSARLSSRNITMKLKFLPQPTVEEIRHKCYKFFPSKKKVTLQFYIDEGVRQIEGYVESNEPVIFTNQEYTQISIVCPDPYFYDSNYTDMVLSGYEPLFEFPFSNESVTENKIIFDDLKFDKRITFAYHGEADTGILIKIHANSEAANIVMVNNDTQERMTINTNKLPSGLGTKLLPTDDVEISTYVGNRSATLIRDGRRYNIINALGRHSDWFTITSGVNTFTYDADATNTALNVSFNYKNKYQGV